MPKTIIFITGMSGSGKSTIAKDLEKETGFPQFSIGKFQRERAKQFGFATLVEFEKKMGVYESYESMWPHMVERVQEMVKQNNGVIVEGIYTKPLFELFTKAFSKSEILVCNITSNRHTRLRRFILREKMSPKEAKTALRKLDNLKRKVGMAEMQKLREGNVKIIPNRGRLSDTLARTRSSVTKRRR